MLKKEDARIIIPHYALKETNYALDECLTSLKESNFPMSNITVAHNGDTFDFLDNKFFEVQEIYTDKQGQCGAVNMAVAQTTEKWILVTNNDMIYPSDWFERFTSLISDESNDCYSPMLIEPYDGAPTFKKYFCGGVGGDWDKQKFLKFANEHTGEGLRSGFNLPFLIKKEVFDLVSGYDIAYDPYGSNSDSDLEYKLKLAGVKMFQNTNCVIYHFGQTSGTFHPSKAAYWSANWNYFIEKWGFPRTDDGIWQATFEIPMDKLKFKPNWINIYSSEGIKKA